LFPENLEDAMKKDFAVSIDDYVQTLKVRHTSPVLLTVPHDGVGGLGLEPFLFSRKNGCHKHDVGVWPIVRDVLPLFEANVVRGLLPRRYLDYNRAEDQAFEAPQFRSSYQAYHGRIFHEVRQMQNQFPADQLLLLDVHGFGSQPPYAPRDGYDLILGTGNRSTVKHGNVDREFAAFLESRGYKVFLPDASPKQMSADWLNGGFTVRSISYALCVNAIQIEIAPRFRHRNAALCGTQLSHDIAAFLKTLAA